MRRIKTDNPRVYGRPPYKVAVLHGGPGAPGSMAPVARRLAENYGVIEPLQTADSVDGQVSELLWQLRETGDLPMTIVGSSWGAMLGFIFASRHPETVNKLIMVGSGMFDARYSRKLAGQRVSRLTPDERIELDALVCALRDSKTTGKTRLFARMGELFTRTDAFDPITLETETLRCDHHIFNAVWPEVETLREEGTLLKWGAKVECPVLAIHGDYDPHPYKAVIDPLRIVLRDFRWEILEKCGHLPWIERQAADRFYEILAREIVVDSI